VMGHRGGGDGCSVLPIYEKMLYSDDFMADARAFADQPVPNFKGK